MNLADTTKVLLRVAEIDSSEVSKQIRTTISDLAGVEVCVPFQEEGWVWIAFDTAKVNSGELQMTLAEIGLKNVTEIQYIPALGALPKNHERTPIYVMFPKGAKSQTLALGAVSAISGVAGVVYDSAYHLLLVDLDVSKTDPQRVRQGIVVAGFAAGLPGEELTQPEPY